MILLTTYPRNYSLYYKVWIGGKKNWRIEWVILMGCGHSPFLSSSNIEKLIALWYTFMDSDSYCVYDYHIIPNMNSIVYGSKLYPIHFILKYMNW